MRPRVVVMGASAGAVESVSTVLAGLTDKFALPIALVVHVPADRDSVLVDVFQSKTTLRVKEAESTEEMEPATVYLAPPDYHLQVESNGRLSLSSDEPIHFSRPSIDVLFETAGDAFGAATVAVILSGANEDGARGSAQICAAGGRLLVQNPEGAVARSMPEAAIRACPDARVLNLAGVALTLMQISAEVSR